MQISNGLGSVMSRCTRRCFPSMCLFTGSIIPIAYCRDLLFYLGASAWIPAETLVSEVLQACGNSTLSGTWNSNHCLIYLEVWENEMKKKKKAKNKTLMSKPKYILFHSVAWCKMQLKGIVQRLQSNCAGRCVAGSTYGRLLGLAFHVQFKKHTTGLASYPFSVPI